MQFGAGEDTLYSLSTIYCNAERFASPRYAAYFEITRVFDTSDKSQELSHTQLFYMQSCFDPLGGKLASHPPSLASWQI